jgi:hypothetical protein
MQSAMRGHLRLHYSAQEGSDERVSGQLLLTSGGPFSTAWLD